MPTIRNRNLCWTWFNYPEDWIKKLENISNMKYVVGGAEICPTTLKPHIQGYIEFNSPTTWDELKTLGMGNIAPRISTSEKASAYCKKDGKFVEFGQNSQQGKRSDLENACDLIKCGASMRKIAEENPVVFVKFHRGLRELKSILTPLRNEDIPPRIVCLWGPTACGKSRLARIITTNPFVWGPSQEKWFDGYEGEQHVIMDEFRGQLTLGSINTITDRYNTRVQCKGGMFPFVASLIVFTSPKHPKLWYTDDNTDKIDQLLRRFSAIWHLDCKKNYEFHKVNVMKFMEQHILDEYGFT